MSGTGVTVRKVGMIGFRNVRAMVLDRRAGFFMFVLPFVVILLVGMATGGTAQARVGLVVEQDGPLVQRLVQRLEGRDDLAVRRYDSVAELERAVRRQSVPAGVVVPADYDAALRSGGEAPVLFVLDRAHFYPGAVRRAVGTAVNEEGTRLRSAYFAANEVRARFEVALELADQSSNPVIDLVAVEPPLEADDDPGGFDYTAPANLILFMFINAMASAAGMIQNRRLGCERRVLSTPTGPNTVVLGDAVGRFGIAMVQASIILLVGGAAFDVDWGSPVAMGLLVVVFGLLSAAAAQLLGTLGKSPDQVRAVAPMFGIGLGMLGGCMWPLEIVGPVVRAVGHIAPHAWAMDAVVELGDGAGVGGILPNLGVLMGFVVVTFVVAVRRLQRQFA